MSCAEYHTLAYSQKKKVNVSNNLKINPQKDYGMETLATERLSEPFLPRITIVEIVRPQSNRTEKNNN